MRDAIDFLVGIDLARLAADPRVIVGMAALAVVAVFMRWKLVILLVFGLCAMLAVARYSELGEAVLDAKMFLFVGGTLATGFILIYFLFIQGD